MERLLQNTAGAISVTVYVADTATDPSPDSATVKVTRADGTILIAAGTAAINAGTGRFSYNLTPANTALLDRLTATWTITLSGHVQTLTTRYEVVGGFLVPAPDLRADSALSDESQFPDDKLLSLRTTAERALEDACRVAFVPRYEHETVIDQGGRWLPVRWRRVRSVRSLTQNGTSLSVSGVTVAGGAVQWAGGSYEEQDITIGYEHGHDFPPPETGRVVSRLVRHYGIDSPLDDRAIRLDADNGSWVMATPGIRGQHFGIPEVDAFVEAHGYKPAGFAVVPIVS